MGIIKTGIQAGVAYAAVNKITKTMEATAQAKHGKQTPPHPPCNCPHCPYSEQSVYGGGAPGYAQQQGQQQQMQQALPPPPPGQTAYGNPAPPPAPYGGRSPSEREAAPYGGGASPRQDRAIGMSDPAPPYDPRADVQALFASAFEKRRR